MARSDVAKQKVRDAASALLRDTGVPAFTVDEVARRSGVAKTTIYRHWANVDALLIDAIACQIESLPTPNTGSLRGDLKAFFDLVIPDHDLDARSRMMFGLLYAAADDPDLRTSLNELVAERTGPLRTIVELARARGEIRPGVDVDHAVDLIEGPFLYRFLLRREPFDEAAYDGLLDLVVAALTCSP